MASRLTNAIIHKHTFLSANAFKNMNRNMNLNMNRNMNLNMNRFILQKKFLNSVSAEIEKIHYLVSDILSINLLKNKLMNVSTKEEFEKNIPVYLQQFKTSFTDNELIHLRTSLLNSKELIKFNEYNYYKHPFLENDFISANLVIWGKNAKTNIHYHPVNGCFIYHICGKWKETIFFPCLKNIKNENIVNLKEINFINNKIGPHCVENISEIELPLSINIYSPVVQK